MTEGSSAPVLAPHLARLNDAQREAVTFGVGRNDDALDQALLVIAGAGSGKTNTLACRVAHLIAHGADPGRILLLTFSRRAAEEMTRRVTRIAGTQRRPKRAAADLVRYLPQRRRPSSAGVCGPYRSRPGLQHPRPGGFRRSHEPGAQRIGFFGQGPALSAQGYLPCHLLGGRQHPRANCRPCCNRLFPGAASGPTICQRLFGAYVEAKQAQQVLDYDDLLLYWARMAAEPDLAEVLGARFSHILVDEYQDTNRLQAAILLGLKPNGRGLTVVGDDAQSIYAFRGATVRNILDFPGHFSPPARLVTLERNYRSTQPILAAANAVIALASERFAKDLWTERTASQRPRLVTLRDDADQANYVVEQVLARREAGVKLKAQAVLFRSGHHSARLEVELTRRNIPFVKFGGLKFLEAAHVKDVLAVLRWARNLRDRVAGFRAIQLLAGIGPKTAARILDNVGTAPPGCALLAEQPVPDATQQAWRDFAALVESAGQRTAGMASGLRTGMPLVSGPDRSVCSRMAPSARGTSSNWPASPPAIPARSAS